MDEDRRRQWLASPLEAELRRVGVHENELVAHVEEAVRAFHAAHPELAAELARDPDDDPEGVAFALVGDGPLAALRAA